jgi:predicted amidohydrolase YtcJ
VAVGTGLAEDLELSKGVQIIDCGGGTIVPGFVDAHLHVFALADRLLSVDLGPRSGVRSIGALVGRLREAAARLGPGQWLKGKGYDNFALTEGRHPDRWDLDAASPDHPVKLTHRSHHAHVLNSLALARVGIDRYTPDPPGGLVERDLETGEPTGLLFELGALLSERIPTPESGQLDRGIERASRELLSVGVTTFQDAGQTNGSLRWEQLRRWKRERMLRQRVSVLLGWEGFQEFLHGGRAAFPPAPGLKLGGLKIVLDRTTGDLHPSRAELRRMVREAHRRGWSVAVHAVEEETLEAALEAFEALSGEPSLGAPRHRIEHCSLCPPRLLRRLAAARVSVVTQPSFLFFHGDRYLKTVAPEHIPDLYPMGAIAAAGVRVAASSDGPVVPARPLTGIAAAVTRRAESGAVLAPDQRVGVDRALRMHTSDAAWVLGLERQVGSVAVGKRADLVVLSGNPLTTPIDELGEIEAVMTLVGGEVIWAAEG